MKLWLLKPIDKSAEPWAVGCYDVSHGFVIRAETEADARHMAAYSVAYLTAESIESLGEHGLEKEWLDPALTSCNELTANGNAEIVVRDFMAG